MNQRILATAQELIEAVRLASLEKNSGEILITWEDPDGLPRAYAYGPSAALEKIRESALWHLDEYTAGKRKINPEHEMATCNYRERAQAIPLETKHGPLAKRKSD